MATIARGLGGCEAFPFCTNDPKMNLSCVGAAPRRCGSQQFQMTWLIFSRLISRFSGQETRRTVPVSDSMLVMPANKQVRPTPSDDSRRPFSERNTEVLSVYSKRAPRYKSSRVFSNELVVVQAELEAFTGKAAKDIFKFLRWFHPDRSRPSEVEKHIGKSEEATKACLAHYVAFASRFRVWMHANLMTNGCVKVRPVYEPISDRYLAARLIKKQLVPITEASGKERKRSARKNHGEHEEDRRAILRDKAAVGYDAQDRYPHRFMRLEVSGDSDSELITILETFYDPLALNFIEIKKTILDAHHQTYLVCLVGELANANDWKRAGSVRTKLISRLYGVNPRGRKRDRGRFAEVAPHVLKHGDNVKASANEISGPLATERESRKITEQVRRATATVAQSTKTFRRAVKRTKARIPNALSNDTE